MGASVRATLLLTLVLTGWSAAPAARDLARPAGQAQAAAAELPRVRLVATGGTISNREGGRLTAEELVKLVPNIGRYARPEFEQFSNTGSAQLSLQQWLDLAKRINRLFADDPGIAGVVVTGGT